ncbi:hypothetical protein A3L08_05110 [Thermococcus pacificus]|uniref:Uncharacterized protein n=2 Tax=Thermococcus pacificus TaxID=71998 RepID=A0A218P7H2_9EURY|nr:hypothetical protein A3L08_05110 [Thermococcus pacificus]
MNVKKYLLVVTVFSLILLIIPKGILVPTNAKGASFKEDVSSLECPFKIQTSLNFENFSYYFTIFTQDIQKSNYTLPGINGGYICIPEGVLLYAYFIQDSQSTLLFLGDNLTEKWKKEFPAYPLKHLNESLILVGNPRFGSSDTSCVYVIDISTGLLKNWFCPNVLGGYISDVKILHDRVYVTIGVPEAPPLRTRAFIYVKEGNKLRKSEIASISGEGVGIRLPIDANEKYVAVAYFLANERGEEKNGVCVLTARSLRKIACKELNEGERPLKVKVKDNIVYVQTTKGVKAYKILSLW